MDDDNRFSAIVVSIQTELRLIEKIGHQVFGRFQLYEKELRFLERFSWLVATLKRSIDVESLKIRFGFIWKEEETMRFVASFPKLHGKYIINDRNVACGLDKKLHDSKRVVEDWCNGLLSCSLTHEPPHSDEILILLDFILQNLEDLLSFRVGKTDPLNDQIGTLKAKLVFLENLIKLTAKCIYNQDFQELETRIHIFANNAVWQTFLHWVKATDKDDANEMDLMLSDLLLRIKPCMPDVTASYFGTLRYDEASTSDDIVNYLDVIINIIKHLVSYKAGKIAPLKKQIETLEQKLVLLQFFVKLAANCVDNDEIQEFMIYVLDFLENAVWLAVVYWLKAVDELIASEINRMLSNLLQKIELCTPDVIGVCFRTLKAMKLQLSTSRLSGQAVISLVDHLLDNLMTAHLKDDFEVLREELIFILTFLADPLKENVNNQDELTVVLERIRVLLREGWHLIFLVDDVKEVSIKIKVHNFQREIETVNDRIRRLYCEFPYPPFDDFPRIIGQGFLDFLIQNLGNLKEKLISDTKCVPFVKKAIWKIEEELVCLRPLINDFLEPKEPIDTWLQVVNLAYRTEHVANSCFPFDYPIWYYMTYLHDVLNGIKDVKTKLEKIKECSVYNIGVLPCSGDSTSIISKQVWTSDINQFVVGFEEETRTIIDELTCGHKSLDIVSIIGMAGSGKTTLARLVCGSPSVKSHFHIFAFCSVSLYQNAKSILVNILRNFSVIDDVSSMTKDDLAHQLWKCLSGRRYLIVMDDMWEVRAWNDVKSSFPDNQNGSRVILTTRFHKVATETQIKCSPYHLGFLSDEKSWELLQKKVFPNESCPPNFSDTGKLIAKNCKGLPLAVVVIAGLLARTEQSLSWWSKIAKQIGSYLSEEDGCMNMLELTYKYLPEYLKPMLLYFGAYLEDTLISVKSLMLLWIAEGFVPESKTRSLEDVAKDYLRDLVDRSLIMVTRRSSNGGIKTVSIHDLIHDFCRIKAQSENFFHLRRGNASSSSSDHQIHNHYRVCLQMDGETRPYITETFPCARSLLSFERHNDPFDTSSITGHLNFPKDHFDALPNIGNLKLLQVLHLENMWLDGNYIRLMSKLHVDLRHIVASVIDFMSVIGCISSLLTLETLILRTEGKGEISLPETIWEMKLLRHANISRCKLIFPGGDEVCSKLENVESFSLPTLSTGKDLEMLMQRLPVVRKLSCCLDKSRVSVHNEAEILDFLDELESLTLSYIGYRSPYVIKFPSTLKKLNLSGFKLPWTTISDIGKLERLEILKLLWNSFVGPRCEMEDVVFPSLKFLKLNGLNLEHWNAVPDCFPCLEQLLVIRCDNLVEIPACFGVILTLKRFEVHLCRKATSSATQIKNEQMDLGNDTLEVEISSGYY